MDAGLNYTQKTMEASVRQVRKVSRKALLVFAGLLGLTYDKVKSALEDPKTLMEEAAQRGEGLRSQADTKLMNWRERSTQVAAKLNKEAKVAQADRETAGATMAAEGGPLAGANATAEPLASREAITAEELTEPTIVIASASADLNELLAAEALAESQTITNEEDSTGPTILIAKS